MQQGERGCVSIYRSQKFLSATVPRAQPTGKVPQRTDMFLLPRRSRALENGWLLPLPPSLLHGIVISVTSPLTHSVNPPREAVPAHISRYSKKIASSSLSRFWEDKEIEIDMTACVSRTGRIKNKSCSSPSQRKVAENDLFGLQVQAY